MSATKLTKQQMRRGEDKQLARAFFIMQYAPIAIALLAWTIAAIELKWI